MKLTSKDFSEGGPIPAACTCDGNDRSPELTWSEAPAETKSFAVFCNDLDVPGGRWVHWIVINIPPQVTSFVSGVHMDGHGQEVENSFKKMNYRGPCPPSGDHRYVFTVYALDVKTLTNVNRADFEKHVASHTLSKASLTGHYSQPII